MSRWRFGSVALLVVLITLPALAQEAADDCNNSFKGKDRKKVKLRTAANGATYQNFNNGNPIALDDWFKMTCSFDPNLPKKVLGSKPIKGLETVKVTIRGFLLGAKYENVAD